MTARSEALVKRFTVCRNEFHLVEDDLMPSMYRCRKTNSDSIDVIRYWGGNKPVWCAYLPRAKGGYPRLLTNWLGCTRYFSTPQECAEAAINKCGW